MTSLTVPREQPDARWPPTWRIVFVTVVLLVLHALIPCERVAAEYGRVPFYGSGRSYNHFVMTSAVVLRSLAAGVLVDAFGIRRVLAVGLIAWCILTTATGFVAARLDLALLDLSTTLALGPLGITSYVVIGTCLPRLGRALPLAIVVVASYLSLFAVPFLHSIVANRIDLAHPQAAQLFQAFLLASIGAFITFVWLLFCPAPDDGTAPFKRSGLAAACDGGIRLLDDRRVWPILLLLALGGFAFEVAFVRIDRFLIHERGLRTYAPYLAGIAGELFAAVASDQRLARTGSPARSRRPFIVAGFLFGAGMALLPVLPQEDLVAMSCIVGFGIGLEMVLVVLALDIVPNRHLGTFVGVMAAVHGVARLAVFDTSIAVYPLLHSYASLLAIGGVASLAGGALAAWSLHDMTPLGEALPAAAAP